MLFYWCLNFPLRCMCNTNAKFQQNSLFLLLVLFYFSALCICHLRSGCCQETKCVLVASPSCCTAWLYFPDSARKHTWNSIFLHLLWLAGVIHLPVRSECKYKEACTLYRSSCLWVFMRSCGDTHRHTGSCLGMETVTALAIGVISVDRRGWKLLQSKKKRGSLCYEKAINQGKENVKWRCHQPSSPPHNRAHRVLRGQFGL